MKKRAVAIAVIAACMALSACSGNPCGKDSDGNRVENVETPGNLRIEKDGDRYILSWDEAECAAGYRVYAGSSKYSEDYAEVTEKALNVTEWEIPDPDGYYKVVGVNGKIISDYSEARSYEQELFGPNVLVFSPTDDPEKVNSELTALFNKQETSQFDSRRYSVLFKPGEYSEIIDLKTGFYTEVNGLGMLPTDTTLQSFNNPATWLGDDGNHNATCNFWRGISNLQINNNVMWAVSQATFMRRMQINGNLYLHDNFGWASGGFLSDSNVTGIIDSGSQQQWLTRNSDFKSWQNDNWNIVFMGNADGKAPTTTWPISTYTDVPVTRAIKEKPFLVCTEDGYGVFVPALRTDCKGLSWTGDQEGELKSLDEFYVAHADGDTAESINAALAEGRNILFTPGIYKLNESLKVEKPGTVILGMGLATLTPTEGNLCMEVADEEGVEIAGLLFDAGEKRSETLLKVGADKNSADRSSDPILLADVFFRVGGANSADTAVDSCVILNANDVIGDNFWVWRADHGSGVGWNNNLAPNGIIVNGDDVKIYALMVEHFQEYQTVWNGDGGLVVFYQSELPYDVPSQNEWRAEEDGIHGYASYFVSDKVKTHTAYGIGIYSYNRDAIVEEYSAMEVPENNGMDLHNVCAVMITGNPGISHVINTYGGPCYAGGTRAIIVDFAKEREKKAAK